MSPAGSPKARAGARGIYDACDELLRSADRSLLHSFGARLADPFGKPEAIVALAGAMGLLMVAYLVLYTGSDLRLDRNRSSDRS